MVAHRILHDMFRAPFLMLDPGGDGGVLTVNRWMGGFPIVTAGAHGRTLSAPTKAMMFCGVMLDTDGGDLTLTVTDGYNQAGTTTIVFGDAGDWVLFVSVKVGANYRWRVVAQEGTTAVLTNLTASALTLNGVATLIDDMTEGSGITGAVNGAIEHTVTRIGSLIKTEIVIDMTGLDGPGTADDIIGKSAAANSHLGQITTAKNGVIFAGEMRCLEAPAGCNIDVDLNAATASDGVENADVKVLAGYAQLLNAGNWTVNTLKGLTAFPAADTYLYLSSGTATEAAVTAGIFVITLWGK